MNFVLVITLLIAALSGITTADIGDYGCNMGGMMYGAYGSGAFIFSWLAGLLVVVALILLIVWLIKQISKSK